MKKQRKILWLFGLTLMVLIGLPRSVDASEKTDAFIRQLAPDGKNITIKSVVPKNDIEADYLMNSVLAKYISNMDGYSYYGFCEGEGYTTCIVDFQSDDYQEQWDSEKQENIVLAGEKITYTLNATYDVPSAANVAMMEKFISKLADNSETYEIGDLSLINYYLTGSKSELWNNGAPSRALKFVKELHEITEGSDVNFFMEARMGTEDDVLMYEDAMGPMSIYYGDYAFTYLHRGLYLKRVIYIPEDTADNKDAYIAAAQERINDYLGEDNGVVVSYGGLLSSLEPGAEDEELSQVSDGNYYNISILGRTYKFYIIEDDDNLEAPTYSAKNIGTDIFVTSDSANVPLDTVVNASKVTSGEEYERIISILNLDDNVTYDVKLFSDAKNEYITKLDDGTFEVMIPVPEGFKDKTLAVYYVKDDGKYETFDAPLTDDKKYVKFTTDHFSIYTLGYKTSNNSVKVVFDANGGVFKNDVKTFDVEDIINFDYDKLDKPTREGYKFVGFYTKDSKSYIDVMNSEAGIEEDIVFYAKWESLSTGVPGIAEPEENPNTLDTLSSSLLITLVSLVGLVGTTLYLKRKERA